MSYLTYVGFQLLLSAHIKRSMSTASTTGEKYVNSFFSSFWWCYFSSHRKSPGFRPPSVSRISQQIYALDRLA